MPRYILIRLVFTSFFAHVTILICAQNVGVGLLTPAGKLHVKGSADMSQLIIDANSTQTNLKPLIRLRKSDGTNLMWIHSDDSTNVFLGFKAGRSNVIGPQGVSNTFIGSRAGYSNTNGRDNTIVGTNAFFFNTKASQNTVVGTNALYTQSFAPGAAFWDSKNVAIGFEALYSNQPTSTGNGVNNTAVGTSTLRTNTTGTSNTANGAYALYLNTSGNDNTAIGYSALRTNTMGSDNIAIGTNALYSNLDLSKNIAIGNGALYSQSITPEGWVGGNVAIGYAALHANYPTTYYNGAYNTAIGNYALTSNITGETNTACGYKALQFNTGGYHNTAIGYGALKNNNAGANTATGWEALVANVSGYDNTATGQRALGSNTEGMRNTAMGLQALAGMSTGDDNTAIGVNALLHNNIGIGNIAAGANSGTADYVPSANNTVSIGNHGYHNGASNQAFIGNLSTAWTGGNTTWFTYTSDARVKDNVTEDVKGLEFISRLRPVTYQLNIRAMREITGNKETADYPEKYDVEKIQQSGFIAQEVVQAAGESGYHFSGVTIPKNDHELYTMSYAQFVVPLVKGMQEQQAIIERQQLQIDQLKSAMSNLQSTIEKLQGEYKTEIDEK